jgi:hypothetical protein
MSSLDSPGKKLADKSSAVQLENEKDGLYVYEIEGSDSADEGLHYFRLFIYSFIRSKRT